MLWHVTVETFKQEIRHALAAYDKYVICVLKTPEDFVSTLESLVGKAIKAYETRPPGMRHGIALDKFVTVILSQTESARPLCGIYFNLHSPYQKSRCAANPQPPEREAIGGAASEL